MKLLQRLLEDRKSTVEVIKREGEKIAASAEPADRVKLCRQLSLLDSRWEALLSRAEARYRQVPREAALLAEQGFLQFPRLYICVFVMSTRVVVHVSSCRVATSYIPAHS